MMSKNSENHITFNGLNTNRVKHTDTRSAGDNWLTNDFTVVSSSSMCTQCACMYCQSYDRFVDGVRIPRETECRCGSNSTRVHKSHEDCLNSVSLATNSSFHSSGEACHSGDSSAYLRHYRNANRHAKHRIAIYENLCRDCGFAIGSGLYHFNCNRTEYEHKVKETETAVNSATNERVYENICESCHSVFNGDNCGVCSVSLVRCTKNDLTKQSVASKHGKQFSNLIGSFRQKFKDKSLKSTLTQSAASKRQPRKIEIIHNFDEVFKTNQSFDINEIVQLKNQSQSADQSLHIYGKLKTSTDHNTSIPVDLNCTDCSTHWLPTHEPNNSELLPIELDDDLQPPSYEDVMQSAVYVSPLILTKNRTLSESSLISSLYSCSSSNTLLSLSSAAGPSLKCVRFIDESVKSWMTSLRQQIHDYYDVNNQFECTHIKCIPSKSFSYCASGYGMSLNQSCQTINESNSTMNADDFYLLRRIEAFKSHFVDRSKRNAIYLKNIPIEIDNSRVQNAIITAEQSVSGVLVNTITESEIHSDKLYPNHECYESKQVTETSDDERLDNQYVVDVAAIHFNELKKFYLSQIALSIGLNRITLVCGDRKMHFLLKLLAQNATVTVTNQNANVLATLESVNFRHLLLELNKSNHLKQSYALPSDQHIGTPKCKVTLSDFIKRPNKVAFDELFQKPQTICNFEKYNRAGHNCSCNSKRLEDYRKPVCDNVQTQIKTMNDFIVKKPHYSSVIKGNALAEARESANKNREKCNDDYQPIWIFKTVGDMNNVVDDTSLECESDTHTDVSDSNEWEVAAEEFLFSSDRRTIIRHSDADGQTRLFRRICILYGVDDSSVNKIIFDYNNTQFAAKVSEETTKSRTKRVAPKCILNEPNKCDVPYIKPKKGAIRFDSIYAWKSMLRSMVEDEEDMVLSESFLLDAHVSEQNENSGQILQKYAESIEKDPLSSAILHKDKSKEVDSDPNELATTYLPEVKTKREVGFLNKFGFDMMKVNSRKDNVVQGLLYKNLNSCRQSDTSPPIEAKTGNLVYGVELEDVEKDEKQPDVPKFVIECIKVIEQEENLRTNGIYRASGKKESIDKLRRKMNESKLRKGTKYVSLKDEDIHTVTGALKQFFRELKTELIPIDIVNQLPNDLENEKNLPHIKNLMNTIDRLPRETLKFLLKHLILVDKYSEDNLMNASNLSIVWGACVFAPTMSVTDTFETTDLIKKNTLFKVLIRRYNDIFADNDRLI